MGLVVAVLRCPAAHGYAAAPSPPDQNRTCPGLKLSNWIDARENKAIEGPEAVGRRAVALVEEWQEVHAPSGHKLSPPKERWRPPMAGWVKVNTDGAVVKSADIGGGGVVVRDHDGRFLAGSSHFFPSLSGPEEAELRACERGMELIKRLKLKNVVLELDCAAVVAKLNSVEVDRSSRDLLIEKLKRALREVDGHVVGIRCIENKKISYRENAIHAKMQSRRRKQRGDERD
ncbi:hypothetical protein QYE76_069531 [Lolium multiflorum]|uniref:RNase H type-1 domain-containing protein n=1 Tax=Lolium multiflorum TaxID=4521 RepID=A0AAD8SGH0_LOLMU|nr:hypothetical protein QYE76_069531 [Lolium multiflorum]